MSRENEDLVARYKLSTSSEASKIFEQLVARNMGLITQIIDRELGSLRSIQAREDVLQDALIGFLAAVKLYDPAKNTRFSTVFALWVRHHVQMSVTKNTPSRSKKTYRIPKPAYSKFLEIAQREQRVPAAEEIGTTQQKLDRWLHQPDFVPYDLAAVDTAKTDDTLDEEAAKLLQDLLTRPQASDVSTRGRMLLQHVAKGGRISTFAEEQGLTPLQCRDLFKRVLETLNDAT